ncbi:hypothetical protein B0H10DRAFT_1356313 [Mycena sp. CBHHK59/15]|nr:hypothetical protein B0H10DRAFT_1356313 [Mycena sp. CBHHK59/15]
MSMTRLRLCKLVPRPRLIRLPTRQIQPIMLLYPLNLLEYTRAFCCIVQPSSRPPLTPRTFHHLSHTILLRRLPQPPQLTVDTTLCILARHSRPYQQLAAFYFRKHLRITAHPANAAHIEYADPRNSHAPPILRMTKMTKNPGSVVCSSYISKAKSRLRLAKITVGKCNATAVIAGLELLSPPRKKLCLVGYFQNLEAHQNSNRCRRNSNSNFIRAASAPPAPQQSPKKSQRLDPDIIAEEDEFDFQSSSLPQRIYLLLLLALALNQH